MAGIDSRRKCEEHVRNGAVQVNGEVVRDLGRQVEPGTDLISFRGRPLPFKSFVYFVLNKPEGYITTASDPHASKTVYDLLPRRLVRSTRQPTEDKARVFPVGRLDKDTMGVLLFTNDGELAHKLMHPRYRVGKWYEARLGRAFAPEDAKRILSGLRLKDGMARAEEIRVVSRRVVHLKICEGRKREVRRIFEALGYQMERLVRLAFGPILIGSLTLGQGRFLGKNEVAALRACVDDSGGLEERRTPGGRRKRPSPSR